MCVVDGGIIGKGWKGGYNADEYQMSERRIKG